MNETEQGAAGTLYGVAIGDALGAATTFISHREILMKFGMITGFIEPKSSRVHEALSAGSFTDDTELTLVLAESIIRTGAVSPDAFAKSLVSWAKRRSILQTTLIGPSTRRAITKLMNGQSPEKSGQGGTTNGCAMRISPVAIVNAGRADEEAKSDVEKACMPTHCTGIAISGATAVCLATKRAIEGERDTALIIQSALDGAAFPSCSKCGRDYRGKLDLRIRHAIRIAEGAGSEEQLLTDLYAFMKGKRKALTEDAVPIALALCAYAEFDFNRVALLSANLGGDCDTIGAIAGAVSGAYTGLGGIRSDWVRAVGKNSDVDLIKTARVLLNAKRH
ncbi:MAG: ADP-ribosylglycohydrolase family protein [Candidatus Thermoplasmatota archaeon]|nr:ADP-ribosylglycohydrolase family protein [Candidatus Thermoplasmatota archaeon]